MKTNCKNRIIYLIVIFVNGFLTTSALSGSSAEDLIRVPKNPIEKAHDGSARLFRPVNQDQRLQSHAHQGYPISRNSALNLWCLQEFWARVSFPSGNANFFARPGKPQVIPQIDPGIAQKFAFMDEKRVNTCAS